MPSDYHARVIFVSKRNSLRNVLAQACLENLAGTRFESLSCGAPAHVATAFHPAALGALASASMRPPQGIPTSWDGLRSKRSAGAKFVITLGDETTEGQPRPRQPDTALWSMPDVAAIAEDEQRALGAIQVLFSLRRRLELFINLPLVKGDRALIRSDVRDLGTMQ